MNFWNDRLTLVGLAGLILVVGVVAYYFVSLETRFERLEAQLKVLTAPSNPAKSVRTNPLIETCQQLYKESVDAIIRNGDFGSTARSHLSSLNCDELLRTAGK
jgi:hypothetical protein